MGLHQTLDLSEKLHTAAKTHEQDLQIAIEMNYGIYAWFKAYLQSKDFAALDGDTKAEAFESWRGLCSYLETINTFAL